ncbi:MAG: FprA family A-type flavoprotein [Firmicutes bacterium]|nr:FprA family A-type flavoprotein [Bacillota bacterium]
MVAVMITNDIRYVGINEHFVDLFEGQYDVPNGMAYNSYLIIDEKIAVMDSVGDGFDKAWFANIANVIGDKTPDYLVIQHMEPDHSASLFRFMENYPNAQLVTSSKALTMIKNFFGTDFADRRVIVGEGDTLSLGKHTLAFVAAPMVHWPEVLMTYDSTDKVLFSADGFGKFGAIDADEEWADEARRYYIGIVGKYGPQVQAVLKKAATLDIQTICPLHGPVLKENLGYYIDLYDKWSSYTPEEEGIFIAYTSVYGHTKKAVMALADKLREKGCNVVVNDLARTDSAQAVANAFRYSKLVLATTTYNMDIFPFMRDFIVHLTERNFCNRTVALIENGSWAPNAAKVMKEMLSKSKNLTYAENSIRILSAPNEETFAQLEALAEELSKNAAADENAADAAPKGKKKFVCKMCGYEHIADELPEGFTCPICNRPASDFEEVAE